MSGNQYRPEEVEARWQQRWAADRLFELDLDAVTRQEKFYNLVEFPYPSAEGLHVGHVYTYCGADTYGRYQRLRGRQVFQPIGFDSFGIHTENFALQAGEHPDSLTRRTIENYRHQLRRMGAAWSWDQEIVTSDPAYYRWTQWVFLKLFEAGLAVRKEAPVVWCPSCLTVLAHEQVEDGRCERCHTAVTERVMEQWFLRITAYADRLLEGLDGLDWPELSKRLQREWIGRSRGVDVDFPVQGFDIVLTAFTTRPETLFGVTFLAVSPRHPQAAAVDGRRAVNPATGETVPIMVAEYVLSLYGTGAVMGVPAHDARDHAFAGEMGLPMRRVIDSPLPVSEGAWTGDGVLVDSGPFTGLDVATARDRIAEWLEKRKIGRRSTRYRLHDWLISRQRYWGPPIPIVYCDGCGIVPVPDDQLPVLLPVVEDFRPKGTGLSPLAAVPEFVNTSCPRCAGPARRETDVSDTFLDSAWYFLRYPSVDVSDRPWDLERTNRLLPVDVYSGGREHVMRHHLYARFVTMALHDLGLVPFAEPFPRLGLHGLLNYEGAKMSKSRGNVVSPDDYVNIGADSLRMCLLFCGPWEAGGNFSDAGLAGIVRFTGRVWALLKAAHHPGDGVADMTELDRTVARVEQAIERFKFNTAIARLMELAQWLAAQAPKMSAAQWDRAARTFTLLLAPFAPHLAEETWHGLGGEYSVHKQRWPSHDPTVLRAEEVELVVQVNGRLRARSRIRSGLSQKEAIRVALSLESVVRHLGGRTPSRIIYVPDRLLNLVV